MFKKEAMFINVVKQNNNLKVEYKKYINNKEISEDDLKIVEKDIDKSMAEFQERIDFNFKQKEKEILTI